MSGARLKRVGFAAIVAVQALLLLGIIYTRHDWINDGRKVLLRTVPVDPRSLMRGDYVRLDYEISTIEPAAVEGDGEFRRGQDVYVALREGSGGVHEAASLWHEPPAVGHPFIKGRVSSVREAQRTDITVEPVQGGEVRHFERIGQPWMFEADDTDKEYVLCLLGGRLLNAWPVKDDYPKCPEGSESLRVILREVQRSKPLTVSVDYTIDSYFVEEGAGKELERMRNRGEVLVEAALRQDGMPLISALIVGGKRLK